MGAIGTPRRESVAGSFSNNQILFFFFLILPVSSGTAGGESATKCRSQLCSGDKIVRGVRELFFWAIG
jgi:hypothetical protein